MRPTLTPNAYQTFTIRRPATPAFWRKATCDEVDCERKRNGWRTVLDVGTATGARTAKWITDFSGRHGSIERAGNQVTFTFLAGQNCFESHRVAIEREPIYIARGGDLRAAVGRRIVHSSGEAWRDHMAEQLDKVREDRARG